MAEFHHLFHHKLQKTGNRDSMVCPAMSGPEIEMASIPSHVGPIRHSSRQVSTPAHNRSRYEATENRPTSPSSASIGGMTERSDPPTGSINSSLSSVETRQTDPPSSIESIVRRLQSIQPNTEVPNELGDGLQDLYSVR